MICWITWLLLHILGYTSWHGSCLCQWICHMLLWYFQWHASNEKMICQEFSYCSRGQREVHQHWAEHKVKRENQQHATNSMFIIKLSISTCFGHHYAHHQENKTVSYCMQCSAWVCRLWSCGAVCTVWQLLFDTAHTVHNGAPQDHSQPQPTHPGRTSHAVGHSLILLMMGIMMPETCLDRKFDNKHRISCILLVLSLHLMFTMHGHTNLKLGWT